MDLDADMMRNEAHDAFGVRGCDRQPVSSRPPDNRSIHRRPAGLIRKSRKWDSATTMMRREGSGIEIQAAGHNEDSINVEATGASYSGSYLSPSTGKHRARPVAEPPSFPNATWLR